MKGGGRLAAVAAAATCCIARTFLQLRRLDDYLRHMELRVHAPGRTANAQRRKP